MEIEYVDPASLGEILPVLRRLTLPMPKSGLNTVLNQAEGKDSDTPWRLDDLGKFCIVMDHERIVGWGAAPKGALYGSLWNGRCLMIFVDSHFRRRGVGSLICKSLKRKYRKVSCIRWNNEASMFYDKLGV